MDSLLKQFDISDDRIRRIVAETIDGADDGELYLEYSESESLIFDNGRLKTANFNTDQGFGLRAVAGEATGYAHSSELSEAALLRASDAVSARQGRLFRHARRSTRSAPTAISMATKTRSPRPASRTRRSCCRKSTPVCAPRIRGCAR